MKHTIPYPDKGTLDANAVKKILPQAYPFVFIDRVIGYEKGKSLTAVKHITANEWPFLDRLETRDQRQETRGKRQEAFGSSLRSQVSSLKSQESLGSLVSSLESRSVFPETLIIEAAAQAVLVFYEVSRTADFFSQLRYSIGKINSEFLKQVQVGEKFEIHVSPVKILTTGGISKIEIKSSDGQMIAQLEMFFSVRKDVRV